MPTILTRLPLGDRTVAIVRRSTEHLLWIVIDSELAGIVHRNGRIRLCDGWTIPDDDLERIRLEALAAAAGENERVRLLERQGGRA
ncbi:hypothetical protein [Salininema proteolyticum]|uniref:Uncharacterized protein n=1 Tax=Salininema proteolyticum TaxID=1607685 RepID=A0ABV8TWH3_9ACTN